MGKLTVEEIHIKVIDAAHRLQRGGPNERIVEKLKKSIKERGVLNPILVIRANGDNRRYQLVSGLHRMVAAEKVGLDTIPARILAQTDNISLDLLLMASDEDFVRKDRNSIDIAELIRAMREEGMPYEAIEKHFRRSRAHIRNWLRLLNLPEEAKTLMRHGELTAGICRALLGLRELQLDQHDRDVLMMELANEAIENDMTTRAVEDRVRKVKAERSNRSVSLRRELETRSLLRIRRQVDRLCGELSDAPKDPDYLQEIFTPLLDQIGKLFASFESGDDSGDIAEKEQPDEDAD